MLSWLHEERAGSEQIYDDIPTSLIGTVFLEGVVDWVGLLVLFWWEYEEEIEVDKEENGIDKDEKDEGEDVT